MLVVFYQKASTGGAVDAMGAPAVIDRNCLENFEETSAFVGGALDARTFAKAKKATQVFLRQHRQRFDERVQNHKIRDAHGDLRAGHIYFCRDRIQIIDCIEFDERFRYVDVISDLAFLCMDLDYLGYPQAARDLIKAYFSDSDDPDGFFLLSFYKCYRAMVRVKVNCLCLTQDHSGSFDKQDLVHETRRYLNLAGEYAEAFSRPMVWVVCGLIATGKSTMAGTLSKTLRVAYHNSDSIRKKPADHSGPAPFQEGSYTGPMTDRTYDQLLRLARQTIEQGRSVVLDATYGSRSHRDAIRQMAHRSGARIVFVECTCTASLCTCTVGGTGNSLPVLRSNERLPRKSPLVPMKGGPLPVVVDLAFSESLLAFGHRQPVAGATRRYSFACGALGNIPQGRPSNQTSQSSVGPWLSAESPFDSISTCDCPVR